jgi:hypothetical protein
MIGSNIPTATTTSPTHHPEFVHRAVWKAGVMAAFNVLTAVLAVRLTLLVAVCGAIALAYLAVGSADTLKVAVLVAYSVLVVVPLVALAARH